MNMSTHGKPEVLVIAGSDSSGLSGIQRDNATVIAMGCHPVNVITANTAQNHEGVHGVYPVNEPIFRQQLRLNTQRPLRAIKIGLLASPSQIHAIISCLAHETLSSTPVILDPVLAASSGETFNHSPAEQASMRRALLELLPYCTVVTPNLDEAAFLTQQPIADDTALLNSARSLVNNKAPHVIMKGGHANSDKARDLFYSSHQSFWLQSAKRQNPNLRGTGCAFSSSLASALALGHRLEDAAVIAKMAINQGIRQSYALSTQPGPVHITHFPAEAEDLPHLWESDAPVRARPPDAEFPLPTLPSGETKRLGIYPVVDRADWLARLLPLGVSTIQLRIKDLSHSALDNEIQTAVALARRYNARLFINDHWELAIKHSAYGVHLGQDDLNNADLLAIQHAGLRLGISTHCHYEVARAHAFRPSYIAFGPIYHTNTKPMPWVPHGPQGFAYWRQALPYALVAIGGIKRERLADVLAQKPDGVAVVTAITLAVDPEATTEEFHTIIEQACPS